MASFSPAGSCGSLNADGWMKKRSFGDIRYGKIDIVASRDYVLSHYDATAGLLLGCLHLEVVIHE